MNLIKSLYNYQSPQQPYIPPFTTKLPETNCSSGCLSCHGGGNIPNTHYLETLETDTKAMKEAKRCWNSSWYPCQPNYMHGRERYKIASDYPEEIRLIRKVWDKHIEQTETNPLFLTIYRSSKAARKISEIDAKLRKKLRVFYHFIEFTTQNPGKTMIINAVCVSFAVLFFLRVFRRQLEQRLLRQ